jgi:hypothetical protein
LNSADSKQVLAKEMNLEAASDEAPKGE